MFMNLKTGSKLPISPFKSANLGSKFVVRQFNVKTFFKLVVKELIPFTHHDNAG
jgi:hypothetical protein